MSLPFDPTTEPMLARLARELPRSTAWWPSAATGRISPASAPLVAGPDEMLRRLDRHGDLFRPVVTPSGRPLGASALARLG